jgi:eukaryotic-like serine/threonine-protein kinase
MSTDERDASVGDSADSDDAFLRAAAAETSDDARAIAVAASGALAGMLRPGALIAGRYRLDRRLGAGGMGVVWAATHVVTRREVALKFLKASVTADTEARRRFLQEARAATAAHHPNVVEIWDVFDLPGDTPVIVMDLLAGETLRERLARAGSLDLETTAKLLLPVISAVGTAHALGIVHRDLKPDNIFLAGDGAAPSVKVLDFGIAKLMTRPDDLEPAVSTGTGEMLGTPCYMAPEQALGERDVDHRADIWALGAIVYECLAGVRPVRGPNIGQVVLQLTGEGIAPIAKVAPRLARDVSAMIDRMLCADRAARPWSLQEIGETLERYAGVKAPSFGKPRVAAGAEEEVQRVRRSRGGSRVLAVVIGGVIAGAVALWWVGRGQEQSQIQRQSPSPSPMQRQSPSPSPSPSLSPNPDPSQNPNPSAVQKQLRRARVKPTAPAFRGGLAEQAPF